MVILFLLFGNSMYGKEFRTLTNFRRVSVPDEFPLRVIRTNYLFTKSLFSRFPTKRVVLDSRIPDSLFVVLRILTSLHEDLFFF